MTEPCQNRLRIVQLVPGGQVRTVDHDDRQAHAPGRQNFRMRAGTTGILGHHERDVPGLHQRQVAFRAERSAVDHNVMIRKRWRRLWRIDQTQKVEVLRIGGESGQVHPPDGQHDPLSRPLQRCDRTGDIGHVDPGVAGSGRPGRAGQRSERHLGLIAGGDDVSAHLCREGMRRIDNMGNAFTAQIIHQPGDTAKATNPLRQRLPYGPFNAPGKGDRGSDARRAQQAAQGSGFGCATKDEQVRLHV